MAENDNGGFGGSVEAGFGGDPNGGGATIDGAPGGTDNNSGGSTVDAATASISTSTGASFGSTAGVDATGFSVGMMAAAVVAVTNPVAGAVAFGVAVLGLSSAAVAMAKDGMSFGGKAVVDASQYSGMVTATEELGNTLGIDQARGQGTQSSFQAIIADLRASPLEQVQELVPVLAGSYTKAIQGYLQQMAYLHTHQTAIKASFVAGLNPAVSPLATSIIQHILAHVP